MQGVHEAEQAAQRSQWDALADIAARPGTTMSGFKTAADDFELCPDPPFAWNVGAGLLPTGLELGDSDDTRDPLGNLLFSQAMEQTLLPEMPGGRSQQSLPSLLLEDKLIPCEGNEPQLPPPNATDSGPPLEQTVGLDDSSTFWEEYIRAGMPLARSRSSMLNALDGSFADSAAAHTGTHTTCNAQCSPETQCMGNDMSGKADQQQCSPDLFNDQSGAGQQHQYGPDLFEGQPATAAWTSLQPPQQQQMLLTMLMQAQVSTQSNNPTPLFGDAGGMQHSLGPGYATCQEKQHAVKQMARMPVCNDTSTTHSNAGTMAQGRAGCGSQLRLRNVAEQAQHTQQVASNCTRQWPSPTFVNCTYFGLQRPPAEVAGAVQQGMSPTLLAAQGQQLRVSTEEPERLQQNVSCDVSHAEHKGRSAPQQAPGAQVQQDTLRTMVAAMATFQSRPGSREAQMGGVQEQGQHMGTGDKGVVKLEPRTEQQDGTGPRPGSVWGPIPGMMEGGLAAAIRGAPPGPYWPMPDQQRQQQQLTAQDQSMPQTAAAQPGATAGAASATDHKAGMPASPRGPKGPAEPTPMTGPGMWRSYTMPPVPVVEDSNQRVQLARSASASHAHAGPIAAIHARTLARHGEEVQLCTSPRSSSAEAAATRARCLERYRHKKANRQYSKKIRYEMRKINADKRPRVKGRFIKLTPDAPAADSPKSLSRDQEPPLDFDLSITSSHPSAFHPSTVFGQGLPLNRAYGSGLSGGTGGPGQGCGVPHEGMHSDGGFEGNEESMHACQGAFDEIEATFGHQGSDEDGMGQIDEADGMEQDM